MQKKEQPLQQDGNQDNKDGRLPNFRGETPFIMVVNGTVDGEPFNIEGRGSGSSLTGNIRGKWVCKSGRLPISWSALTPTIGNNGAKVYVNYPNGITHFFHECLPEGYTQERVARYQNDGTIKSYHEVTFKNGIVMNKVTIQGEGFKKDSPVINDGIKVCNPVIECVYPFENGVRSISHYVFPLKGLCNGFIVAEQMTVNRPLLSEKMVRQPKYHLTISETRQSRDIAEEGFHMIQEDTAQAFDLKLFCAFKNCHSS